MRLVSRSSGSFCALTLRALSRGLKARVEVSDLGFHGVTSFIPIEPAAIRQFIAELEHFGVDQLGEATLQCSSPLASARLRVYTLDRARHVGVHADLMRSQYLQSQFSQNSVSVTFELDPSRLAGCVQALEMDLSSALARM